MQNYSMYITDPEVMRFLDGLKKKKTLSPRVQFIIKMHLTNEPDPIESEISYHKWQIQQLEEHKEENGYKFPMELEGLRDEALKRYKEIGHSKTIGWLGGPGNKKQLKKYSFTPQSFLEAIV